MRMHCANKIFLTCLLAIAGWSNHTYAQEKEVQLNLDTQRIAIGEQIRLKLELRSPAQDTVQWPIIGDTLMASLEVVQKSPIDTTYDSLNITTRILTQGLTITSFDSGYHALPPFLFTSGSDTLITQAYLIEVQTIEVDTSKAINDIKQPLGVDFSFTDWLRENWRWLTAIVAAIALFVLLVYLMTRKKEKPREEVIRKPLIPAHELALKKLNELNERKLWQSGSIKQYHSELSEIVREYIEFRFHVNALEQTTAEIIQNLRTVLIQEEQKAHLIQLLVLSDLVKFAKEKPIAMENELSMNQAVEFVRHTIPVTNTDETDIKEKVANV